MADKIQRTHSEECWRWHPECAERKVEALLAEGRILECERDAWHDEVLEWRKWLNTYTEDIPSAIWPEDVVEHCNKRVHRDGKVAGLCVLPDGHMSDCAHIVILGSASTLQDPNG